ncbi:hypothetical protein U0C82_03665 [Fulvimarina sp. 2208YS6-2-32]|uniref:Tail fiber domain-containing protein n=1 Tax=Fulvimarina uroteuthidis TaxID=3098149 RepID=A0ABU5I265_9HYPH|nr:hypothetical protein [Fulvimarina sp. 2208YS6-2-32]MDY8108246.1 hypothetical protein [Fulvimarina sp. 2208YS6-2-32]
MAYGIVQNGVVANAAEATSDFAASQGWPELPAGIGIGWRYEDGEFLPPEPEPFDAPAARAEALATAIAYGNRITQGEINQWAGVEPFSWTQQRDEAKIVRDGGTLGEDAILPGLADDKGITLEAYADDVWTNAMRYQSVLRAAVYLRRTATNTLTDESLDTPEKIAEAVAALTVEADALAAQLLGGQG